MSKMASPIKDNFSDISISDDETNDLIDINPKKKVVLKDFQLDAIKRITYNEEKYKIGTILALDMGLGKSLTFAQFLLNQREKESKAMVSPVLPDLLIVPLAVINQWKREILRLKSNAVIFLYHGNRRATFLKQELETDKVEFVISTYHCLVTRELEKYKWNRIILDEAHEIRNGIETKLRTKSDLPKKVIGAYAIKECARFCHCITGTPFNNSSNDIRSLMQFVGYHKLDEANVKAFIKQFVIQKSKDEILEPIHSNLIYIEKPQIDLSEYNFLVRLYNNFISKMRKANFIEAKELHSKAMRILTRLRVFCDLMTVNSMKLVIVEEKEEYDLCKVEEYTPEEKLTFYDSSIKLKTVTDSLIEKLPLVPFKRIIVFSSWVSVLEILDEIIHIKDPNIRTYMYTGKTTLSDRERIVKTFTDEDNINPMILLASFGAGSCGLNLTPCSTVFTIDVPMNPFDEMQAVNRVHRITQTNKVEVYKFCMKNMIEEKILETQVRKINEAKDNGILVADIIGL